MTFTINSKRELVPRDEGLLCVKKDVPSRKVTLPVELTSASDYMWKKTDPFVQVNSTCACSDCLNCARSCFLMSRLDRVDPARRAKVFIRRKLAWLGG